MLAWFLARLRAVLIPLRPVPVPISRRPLRRRTIDL
jgi:hypothetical protein